MEVCAAKAAAGGGASAASTHSVACDAAATGELLRAAGRFSSEAAGGALLHAPGASTFSPRAGRNTRSSSRQWRVWQRRYRRRHSAWGLAHRSGGVSPQRSQWRSGIIAKATVVGLESMGVRGLSRAPVARRRYWEVALLCLGGGAFAEALGDRRGELRHFAPCWRRCTRPGPSRIYALQ